MYFLVEITMYDVWPWICLITKDTYILIRHKSLLSLYKGDINNNESDIQMYSL